MNQKRNLILQTAIAAAFGLTGVAAHAGSGSSNASTIATAAIKDDTTTARGAQVAYSTQVPLAIVSTPFWLYVKLNVGKFASAPVPANVITTSGTSAAATASLTQSFSTAVATLSTDSSFFAIPFNTTAAAVPVNQLIQFTPQGTNAGQGEVNTMTSLLGGGNVGVSVCIGASLSKVAPVCDVDTPSGGNNITFVAAETFVGYASSATGFTLSLGGTSKETAVIDVAGGTGIAFANNANSPGTGSLDFGGFFYKDSGLGALFADLTSPWTIANVYTQNAVAVTVSGNFAAAANMFVASAGGSNCASGLSLASLSLNTAKTIATAAGFTIQAAGQNGAAFICMTVDGKTVIPPTQPTLTATLKPNAVPGGSTLGYMAAPFPLYNLGANGGAKSVRSYLPAATVGYISVIRVINLGSNPAVVSMAVIDDATGVTGSAAALPGTIQPGGAANFTSAQIEAAVGAIAAGKHPRIHVTAPTTISVQHYIVNPNGTLTTLHSSDDDENF